MAISRDDRVVARHCRGQTTGRHVGDDLAPVLTVALLDPRPRA